MWGVVVALLAVAATTHAHDHDFSEYLPGPAPTHSALLEDAQLVQALAETTGWTESFQTVGDATSYIDGLLTQLDNNDAVDRHVIQDLNHPDSATDLPDKHTMRTYRNESHRLLSLHGDLEQQHDVLTHSLTAWRDRLSTEKQGLSAMARDWPIIKQDMKTEHHRFANTSSRLLSLAAIVSPPVVLPPPPPKVVPPHTMCATNYHVINHECVACGGQKLNRRGDDPLGRNTTCDGQFRCSSHEYATKSNATMAVSRCVACPAGTAAATGNDPATDGGPNHCRPFDCLPPTTPSDAYNMTTITSQSLTATDNQFNIQNITCSSGYVGIPLATSCAVTQPHHPSTYALSGCVPAPDSDPAARASALAVQLARQIEQYLHSEAGRVAALDDDLAFETARVAVEADHLREQITTADAQDRMLSRRIQDVGNDLAQQTLITGAIDAVATARRHLHARRLHAYDTRKAERNHERTNLRHVMDMLYSLQSTAPPPARSWHVAASRVVPPTNASAVTFQLRVPAYFAGTAEQFADIIDTHIAPSLTKSLTRRWRLPVRRPLSVVVLSVTVPELPANQSNSTVESNDVETKQVKWSKQQLCDALGVPKDDCFGYTTASIRELVGAGKLAHDPNGVGKYGRAGQGFPFLLLNQMDVLTSRSVSVVDVARPFKLTLQIRVEGTRSLLGDWDHSFFLDAAIAAGVPGISNTTEISYSRAPIVTDAATVPDNAVECGARSCSSNGYCTSTGACTCNPSWTGDDCSTPRCAAGCVHGVCASPSNCECDDGYEGTTCAQPTRCATLVPQAYQHIACSAPDKQNITGDMAAGVQCKFSCDNDHRLSDSDTLTCNVKGQWDKSQPICLSNECHPPKPPTHGAISCTGAVVGSTCMAECYDGYEAIGTGYTHTCNTTGIWSIQWPRCRRRLCPAYPSADGATTRCSGRAPGAVCAHTCAPGHRVTYPNDQATPIQTCQDNGNWSHSPIACKLTTCEVQDVPDNTRANCTGNSFGDTCVYECDSGYRPTHPGPKFQPTADVVDDSSRIHMARTCLSTGIWSAPPVLCVPVDCGAPSPAHVAHGEVVCNMEGDGVAGHGSVCRLQCHSGYEVAAGVSEWTCHASGLWTHEHSDNDVAWCEAIKCPRPRVQNGHTNCTGLTEGHRCHVTCDVGYRAVDSSKDPGTIIGLDSTMAPPAAPAPSECTKTSWSPPIPTCQKRQCAVLSAPTHGDIACTTNTRLSGDVCTVKCHVGYQLDSDPATECTSDGKWTGPVADCIPTLCGPAPRLPGQPTCSGTRAGSRCNYVCNPSPPLIQTLMPSAAVWPIKTTATVTATAATAATSLTVESFQQQATLLATFNQAVEDENAAAVISLIGHIQSNDPLPQSFLQEVEVDSSPSVSPSSSPAPSLTPSSSTAPRHVSAPVCRPYVSDLLELLAGTPKCSEALQCGLEVDDKCGTKDKVCDPRLFKMLPMVLRQAPPDMQTECTTLLKCLSSGQANCNYCGCLSGLPSPLGRYQAMFDALANCRATADHCSTIRCEYYTCNGKPDECLASRHHHHHHAVDLIQSNNDDCDMCACIDNVYPSPASEFGQWLTSGAVTPILDCLPYAAANETVLASYLRCAAEPEAVQVTVNVRVGQQVALTIDRKRAGDEFHVVAKISKGVVTPAAGLSVESITDVSRVDGPIDDELAPPAATILLGVAESVGRRTLDVHVVGRTSNSSEIGLATVTIVVEPARPTEPFSLECDGSSGGTWTGAVPNTCALQLQPILPTEIANGKVICGRVGREARVTCSFSCDSTHELVGPQTRTFVDGRWTGSRNPVCHRILCRHLSPPANALDVRCPTGRGVGSSCTVECLPTHRDAFGIRTCSTSGWSGREFQCEAITCAPYVAPPHSSIQCTSSTPTATDACEVTCLSNHRSQPDATRIAYCQPTGVWSVINIQCEPIMCPSPPVNRNTVVVVNGNQYLEGTTTAAARLDPLSSHVFGSTATYKCSDPLMVLVGSAQSSCTHTATWSSTPPTCHTPACPPPPTPNYGNTTCVTGAGEKENGHVINSTCTFECTAGYRLQGPKQRVCTPHLNWLPATIPTCVPITCGPPQPVARDRLPSSSSSSSSGFGDNDAAKSNLASASSIVNQEIDKYRNKASGKTIVIIGAGPSLTQQQPFFDYAKANGFLLFANNRAGKAPAGMSYDIDYWLASDPIEWKRMETQYRNQQVKSGGTKFCAFWDEEWEKLKMGDSSSNLVHYDAENRPETLPQFMAQTGCTALHNDGNIILDGIEQPSLLSSSIFITAQLALLMNPAKIVLVGCDCADTTGKDNPMSASDKTMLSGLVQGWAQVRDYRDLKYPNVQIESVAPVGLKDMFPPYVYDATKTSLALTSSIVQQELDKYRNKASGKTIVIIGAGPSLTQQQPFFDYAKANGFLLFANNRAGKAPAGTSYDIDYWLASDTFEWKRMETQYRNQPVKPGGTKFCAFWDEEWEKLKMGDSSSNLVHYDAENRPETLPQFMAQTGCTALHNNANVILDGFGSAETTASSIFITVQLALLMNPAKIVLVGCDCADTTGKENPMSASDQATLDGLTKGWAHVRDYRDLKYPNVQIESVAPVGLKDMFPPYVYSSPATTASGQADALSETLPQAAQVFGTFGPASTAGDAAMAAVTAQASADSAVVGTWPGVAVQGVAASGTDVGSDVVLLDVTEQSGFVSPDDVRDPNNPEPALVVTCSGHNFLDRCTSYCAPGHVLIGSDTRVCAADGAWTGHEVTCRPIMCPRLEMWPQNGQLVCEEGKKLIPGVTCRLKCDEGYTPNGDATRTCGPAGRWDGTPAVCVPKSCGSPPAPKQGAVACPSGSSFGQRCSFSCLPGHHMEGESETRCGADGQWTARTPACVPATCKALAPPVHGRISCSGSTLFHRCVRQCNAGYELASGDSPDRICGVDAQWTLPNPTATMPAANACRPRVCPAPIVIDVMGRKDRALIMTCETPGGSIERGPGSVCRYSCIAGYRLVGSSVRHCSQSKAWTGTQSSCRPMTCPPPPPNCVFDTEQPWPTPLSYPFNSTCTPECPHPSHSSPRLRCGENGMWAAVEPTQCIEGKTEDNRYRLCFGGADCTHPKNFCGEGTCDMSTHTCVSTSNATGCRYEECTSPPFLPPGTVSLHPINVSNLPLPVGAEWATTCVPNLRETVGWDVADDADRLRGVVHCGVDGQWHGTPAMCGRAHCPPLDHIVNGQRTCGGHHEGALCSTECDKGFVAVVPADAEADGPLQPGGVRRCTMTGLDGTIGRWNGTDILCRPVTCEHPVKRADDDDDDDEKLNRHVGTVCTGTSYGDVCVSTCHVGHAVANTTDAVEALRRTCGADGEWTGQAPVCLPLVCSESYAGLLPVDDPALDAKACDDMPSDLPRDDTHSCAVTCADGHSGGGALQCGPAGWTGAAARCQQHDCGAPSTPFDGMWVCDGHSPGSRCALVCSPDTHYPLALHAAAQGREKFFGGDGGGDAMFTDSNVALLCSANGSWAGPTAACLPHKCALPPIDTSRADVDCIGPVAVGASCKITCKPGYEFHVPDDYDEEEDGPWHGNLMQCGARGAWGGPVPSCHPAGCGAPKSAVTGIHTHTVCSGTGQGDQCLNRCTQHGERIAPVSVATCHEGQWVGSPPECVAPECEDAAVVDNTLGQCNTTSCARACDTGFRASPEMAFFAPEVCTAPRGGWSRQVDAGVLTCDVVACPPLMYPYGVELACSPEQLSPTVPDETVCTASCLPGFVPLSMSGVASITHACTDAGQWSPPESLRCGPVDCGLYTPPEDATAECTGTMLNNTCTVACEHGYEARSESPEPQRTSGTVRCTEAGTWSSPALSCVPPACEPLALPDTVEVQCVGHRTSRQCFFSCPTGHRHVGVHMASCVSDARGVGEWDMDTPPACEPIECAAPPAGTGQVVDPNAPGVSPELASAARHRSATALAALAARQERHPFGAVVTTVCPDGQISVDGGERECTASGAWTGVTATCAPADCGMPPPPTEGVVKCEGTEFGQTCTYECIQPADKHHTHASVVYRKTQCGPAGNWQPLHPLTPCTLQGCPELPMPQHASYPNASGVAAADLSDIVCDAGHVLVPSTLECDAATGQWGGRRPVCEPATCPDLPPPTHGDIEISSFQAGVGIARITCAAGFRLPPGGAAAAIADAAEGAAPSTAATRPAPSDMRTLLRRCTLEGVWTEVDVRDCKRVTCPPPEPLMADMSGGTDVVQQTAAVLLQGKGISHAAVVIPLQGDPFRLGDTVLFRCPPGSRLIGAPSRYCTSAGTWTGPARDTRCAEVTCPAVPPEGALPPGATTNATAQESAGFPARGRITQADGSWPFHPNEATFVLRDRAPDLIVYNADGDQQWSMVLANGSGRFVDPSGYYFMFAANASADAFRAGAAGRYAVVQGGTGWQNDGGMMLELDGPAEVREAAVGEHLTIVCPPGHDLLGDSEVACLPTGAWSVPDARCVVRSCMEPPSSLGSAHTCTGLYVGDTCTYQCVGRYTNPDPDADSTQTITCGADGQWDQPPVGCLEPICSAPPRANVHTHVSCPAGASAHSVCATTCDAGFDLRPQTQCEVKTVRLSTQNWGHEISWNITGPNGYSCAGGPKSMDADGPFYDSHAEHDEECCLPVGSYTLQCFDMYGDGWNGGRLSIDGVDYCHDFTSGHYAEPRPVQVGACDKALETVKVKTTWRDSDVKWTLTGPGGTCEGGPYLNRWGGGINAEFDEACCLPHGAYTLECVDLHGDDGWHGASVSIDGVTYCGDFNDGARQTEEVEIGLLTSPFEDALQEDEMACVVQEVEVPKTHPGCACERTDGLTGPVHTFTWGSYSWELHCSMMGKRYCGMGYYGAQCGLVCPKRMESAWVGPATKSACEVSKCNMTWATPLTASKRELDVQCSQRGDDADVLIECAFSCDRGFRLVGPSSTTCEPSGDWSSEPPTCVPLLCPPLVVPPGAIVGVAPPTPAFSVAGPAPLGAAVSVTCPRTHKRVILDAAEDTFEERHTDHVTRKCGADGTWAGPAILCEPLRCADLEIANTRPKTEPEARAVVGEARLVACQEGYQVAGASGPRTPSAEMTCQLTGEFAVTDEGGVEAEVAFKDPVVCEPIECPPLTVPEHAYGVCTNGGLNCSGVHGSVCHATCELGYTLTTPAETSMITCTAGGTWLSASPPVCSPVACDLPDVPNGFYECPETSYPPANATYPDACTVTCNVGFHPAAGGATSVACTKHGRIDGPPAACVPAMCPALPALANGQISLSGVALTHTTEALYTCHPGYRLALMAPPSAVVPAGATGNMTLRPSNSTVHVRTCGPDGVWVGAGAACRPIRCPEQALPAGVAASCSDPQMTFQSTCDFHCNAKGLQLALPVATTRSACQADGTWTLPQPPTCVALECPPLVVTRTSQFNVSCVGGGKVGTVCTYRCAPGARQLTGDMERRCTDEGRWTGKAPLCTRAAEPQDLAAGRPTQQSSTKLGGHSHLAVAGNPPASGGEVGGPGAADGCTHTFAEEKPWWRVDLGTSFRVKQVIVERCGGSNCSSMAAGIRVSAGNSLAHDGATNPLCPPVTAAGQPPKERTASSGSATVGTQAKFKQMAAFLNGLPPEQLKAGFDAFDADHDGRLAAAELFAGFPKVLPQFSMSEDEVAMLMGLVDANGDGKMSLPEVAAALAASPAPKPKDAPAALTPLAADAMAALPSQTDEFACGMSKARYITVHAKADVASLSLHRVRVIGYAEDIESLHTPDVIELSYHATVVQADGGSAVGLVRGRCTTVEERNDPWIRIDLKTARPIHNVSFRAPDDPHSANYKFEVRTGHSLINDGNSNPACSPNPHLPLTSNGTGTVSCGGVVGRYINIRTPGTSRTLSVCDVRVLGEEEPHTPPPRLLVSTAGEACTQQGSASDNSHRLIALPANADVSQVVVRTDAAGPAQVLRVELQMETTDDARAIACGSSASVAAGGTMLVECDVGVGGRAVKVSAQGWNQTLSICDVEVFGQPRLLAGQLE